VQVSIITGKPAENCKDGPKQVPEIPNECKDDCSDAEAILRRLVCVPPGLAFDIDSIFKSASDVRGIQVFSNLGRLSPLQTKLEEQSKGFVDVIKAVVKRREDDIKNAQTDLVNAVKETTKSADKLYTSTSNFRAIGATLRFICCPKCGKECVHDHDPCQDCNTQHHRLHHCEEEICHICSNVKDTFCAEPDDNVACPPQKHS
jgi:hypothetical protein